MSSSKTNKFLPTKGEATWTEGFLNWHNILKFALHSDIVKKTSDIPEDLQYLRTQKREEEKKKKKTQTQQNGRGKTKERKEGLIHKWSILKRNVDLPETGVSQS